MKGSSSMADSNSSTLPRTNSLIWPLITSSFSCTIFSDIVCCLLSNVCVVTSFYQSLQAMSSFMRFSICASYFTLSFVSPEVFATMLRRYASSGETLKATVTLRHLFFYQDSSLTLSMSSMILLSRSATAIKSFSYDLLRTTSSFPCFCTPVFRLSHWMVRVTPPKYL